MNLSPIARNLAALFKWRATDSGQRLAKFSISVTLDPRDIAAAILDAECIVDDVEAVDAFNLTQGSVRDAVVQCTLSGGSPAMRCDFDFTDEVHQRMIARIEGTL